MGERYPRGFQIDRCDDTPNTVESTSRVRNPWRWGPAGVGMLFVLIALTGVLNSLGQATGDAVLVAGLAFACVAGVVVLAVWLYRR